jgi:ATP-dependent DNA ligase
MLWRISRRDPPADFILPCRPTLVATPPAGPGWLHEMKHDGFRILAVREKAALGSSRAIRQAVK